MHKRVSEDPKIRFLLKTWGVDVDHWKEAARLE